ncbi:hypothetical protein [Jannaschia donghaensis]|uniref:DUF3329 domain-containing protein n=1 Tax=Jannaschia donghaensis TaxID=420998 RepID=A0A0M6YG25_9RHOB|nr:hypothetical protein [Jannaschia donghaensis]CTQ48036.1 hypothetical protein JDO7802_00030 [Jannaschia donghaensis]
MAGKPGFLDVQVPMFVPLWRRVLAVVVFAGWTVMEVVNGAWGWAALFGGSAAYLAHQFFIAWEGPAGD